MNRKNKIISCFTFFLFPMLLLWQTTFLFPGNGITKFSPKHVSINKNLDLYIMKNHELPVVQVFILSGKGDSLDPKGKEGLTAITWRMLIHGRTGKLDHAGVEERLDYLGSSLQVKVEGETSKISLWTLKRNYREAWAILKNLFLHPAFDKIELDSEKQRELASIRGRMENQVNLTRSTFNSLIYGEEHRRGRSITETSLDSITLEDVKEMYYSHIRDSKIIIAVTGDVSVDKTVAMIQKDFQGWGRKFTKKQKQVAFKMRVKPGIYFLNRGGASQATVCMGHPGISSDDPENAEIDVLNLIYGSGMNSRLMREIRMKRGLAYFPYGAVLKKKDIGIFINICQTENKSVSDVIKVIFGIMRDIREKPVSLIELDTAKRHLKNSVVFRYESPEDILLNPILYTFSGYGAGYLDNYSQRIKRVNASQILSLAQRTIQPDNLVILVAGSKDVIVPQLEALNMGPVIEL